MDAGLRRTNTREGEHLPAESKTRRCGVSGCVFGFGGVNKQLCQDYVLGKGASSSQKAPPGKHRRRAEGRKVKPRRNRRGWPRGREGCVWGLEARQALRGREAAVAPAFARPRAARQGPPLADASLPFCPAAGPGPDSPRRPPRSELCFWS